MLSSQRRSHGIRVRGNSRGRSTVTDNNIGTRLFRNETDSFCPARLAITRGGLRLWANRDADPVPACAQCLGKRDRLFQGRLGCGKQK